MNKLVVITAEELMNLIKDCVREELNAINAANNTVQSNQVQDQLLTTAETCCLLKISKPTLIKLKKNGKIPFREIGRRHLFSRNELLNASKSNGVK